MKTRTLIVPLLVSLMTGYGSLLSAQQSVEAEGSVETQGSVEVNESGAQAAQSTELDITLTVVGEDEDAEDVVEPIALPERASQVAVEHSASGLATANAARENGREFGQATAEQARERGSENAENALTQARENVKDNIPEGRLDNIPENVRDNIPEQVRSRLGLDGEVETGVDVGR